MKSKIDKWSFHIYNTSFGVDSFYPTENDVPNRSWPSQESESYMWVRFSKWIQKCTKSSVELKNLLTYTRIFLSFNKYELFIQNYELPVQKIWTHVETFGLLLQWNWNKLCQTCDHKFVPGKHNNRLWALANWKIRSWLMQVWW